VRNVPAIWDTWNAGGPFVGDTRPATRVTVEPSWLLRMTGSVLGTWNRGPARWYQDQDHDFSLEVELPNVVSVNISRGIDADAGSCDIALENVITAALGDPEVPPGQFGTVGAFTFDHGGAQDAKARWQQVPNQWSNVLVPNALIRTYQGFGGHTKAVADAVADGNIILNGVWLVDDVSIGTDGTLSVKCRDMAKLLIDQQLFPPLVPENLYPLLYKRWDIRTTAIPPDQVVEDYCYWSVYGQWDPMISKLYDTANGWHSSTDEYYGQYNTWATGHPPAEAFDMSFEPADAVQAVTPGFFSHQKSYWLSEPKGGPNDWVWLEFTVENGTSRPISHIYYHPLYGSEYVQVSVFEGGEWVAPETPDGGTTVHGLPYVGTFVGPSAYGIPGVDTNQRPLPRSYHATRVRLTLTNLSAAAEGGYRAGARKVMACYNPPVPIENLVFAGASIPLNNDSPQRIGYWEVRGNGHVYAFGDARTYPSNAPQTAFDGLVIAMAVHPSGQGYWLVDNKGRVTSHGQAQHFGDLEGAGYTNVVDIAPSYDGQGYLLLNKQGIVSPYGSASYFGDSSHAGTHPTGAPAVARSIETHLGGQGYWVAWSDGFIDAFNVGHFGNADDRTGFTPSEYITTIRRTSTGNGYWVLSGGGHVQAKGDAVHFGNFVAPIGSENEWYKHLTWDLLPSSAVDGEYGIVQANGSIEPRGDYHTFGYGSVGEGSARQRFDGNYKDYSDIIKELLLWSGFYLHKDPQPETEMPDVYGNIETTGAWSDNDLPTEMFDKRPPFEAIKEIRDIVGYQFFIDAEGGARFESPNWWALGNYLIDGTPYPHIPEIDETVQLLGHNVTRSASAARSRLIIANANPMPAEAGKPPMKDLVVTEIVPRSQPDLRGLVVPAMWVNQAFLKKEEQKIMAELVDLRSWFSRRTASISCVANPLIDVNDQVRVVERQTGDVYIHYVRSISISHDLQTGSFTMNLNTHWLGGSPYGVNQLYRAGDSRPQRDGHWLATIGGYTREWGDVQGGVYAFGNAHLYDRNEADSHLDVIVAFRSTGSGEGYYTVDRRGKVLSYGDAVNHGDIFRPQGDVVDMAISPTGGGYWLLRQDGTIDSFGDATFWGNGTPIGGTITDETTHYEAIESHPTTDGYWLLRSDGIVEAFNLPVHGNATRAGLTPTESFTALRRTEDGGGYWVLSAGAVVQAFGNASYLGDGTRYPADRWVSGLAWTLIPGPGNGYAIVHSDGVTETFDFPHRTPIGGTDRQFTWSIVDSEMKDKTAADAVFGVSVGLTNFLKNTGSPAANNAVAAGFGADQQPALKAIPS
jgi:hypothetical protein